MCEHHKHVKLETWITPQDSQFLSAKMIQMFPGESMPTHTTGPGREEVIVCIYGKIIVIIGPLGEPKEVVSGNAIFIPENTLHSVQVLENEDPAQYAYVAVKRQEPVKTLWTATDELNHQRETRRAV